MSLQTAEAICQERIETLYRYFGKPSKMVDFNVDEGNRIMDSLPQAFIGRSKAMETIFETRLLSRNEWPTRLLPWELTNEFHVSILKMSFEPQIMDVTPFHGIPNVIEHSSSRERTTLIHRGIGFKMSHEFWKTPQGDEMYHKNLQAIENSALFTAYFVIIDAALRAGRRNFGWEIKGQRALDIEGAARREYRSWAILNKGTDRFRRHIAEVEEYLLSQGAKANICALPPKSKTLLTHMHASETDYSQAGPLAVETRKRGSDVADKLSRCSIEETMAFPSEMFSPNTEPLTRLREWGSFFWITNFFGSSKLESYESSTRFAAKIFDARNGGQETLVKGADLLDKCGRFDVGGALSHEHYRMLDPGVRNDLIRRLHFDPRVTDLDMFIAYDHRRGGNGFRVMKYFGEMRQSDVSDDNLREFAITGCNNLSGLSSEEKQHIRDIPEFFDWLNTIDFDDPLHKDYLKEIVTLTMAGDRKANRTLPVVKDNGYGFVDPPTDAKFTVPLGFGCMPGMRTLVALQKRGTATGYKTEIMEKAKAICSAVDKFKQTWDKIFPGNELGSADSCPYYHKSSKASLNASTVFVSNLIDQARFPVFTLQGIQDFDVSPKKSAILPEIRKVLVPSGDSSVYDEVVKVYEKTESPILIEALTQTKTWNTVLASYRSFPLPGKTNLYEFLAFVATGTADEIEKKIERVFERLAAKQATNWEKELEDALFAPRTISARGQPAKTITKGINIRICVNFSSFASFVENGGSEKDLRVLPIDILHPLSAFNPANNALSNITSKMTGRNTIHTLTNSGIMRSHSGESPNITGNKREATQTASSPFTKQRGQTYGNTFSASGATPFGRGYTDLTDPFSSDEYGDTRAAVVLGESDLAKIFAHDPDSASYIQQRSSSPFDIDVSNRFHEANNETDMFYRIMIQSWLTTAISQQAIENFIRHNCVPLIAFELHRIKQQYMMGSGFIAEGGKDLGKLFYGFADFQWGDDVGRKEYTGHYTICLAPMITDDRKIVLLPDIVAQGPHGKGEHVTFIKSVADLRVLIEDPDNSNAAILVKMVPYNRPMPRAVQDVAGIWNKAVVEKYMDWNVIDPNLPHGNSMAYYAALYDLDKLNQDVHIDHNAFRTGMIQQNTIVWQGHQRLFDPVSGGWSQAILDQGLFGGNYYQGCMAAREMSGPPLKDADSTQNFTTYAG